MSNATVGKRVGALSAAFAIALAAGTVGAEVVYEAPTAQAQAASTIDNNQQLSLTLHKRIGAEGEQGNGTEITNPSGEPAKDVKYKIELVQPLNNSGDWEKARKITNPSEAKAWTGDGAYSKEGTTGEDGTLKFENLSKGLYKVTETQVPADSGLVPGAPFLVYVPMTNSDNKSWIYDVHAYPKNSKVTITKEVEDQNAQAGQDYKYTITTGVPAVAKNSTLKKYIVKDVLDPNLDAVKATVEVKYGESADKAQALVADTDYQLVKDGQEIKVEFTEAGRDKLKSTDLVFTTIKTKTNGFIEHVPNDATLITNNGSSEHDTEKKSDKVHTYWGKVTINKTDGNDENKKLQGAEFQLVQCVDDGNGVWKKKEGTDPLNVQGQDKWTTNDQGTVTIEGVHVTDFANNQADEETNYCLHETKAPEGYVANDALEHFELKKGEVDKNGAPTADIKYTANIKNYTDENHLPNTGGAGFWAIVLAGLAIIGGGFYAARRSTQQ
ncbi:SpaH/EbpB family LPXTG-anchored major pilin [Corynebacterium sp. c9Ua_112]|uniref:SpaH/EbpB family LPXTG-anchored major pilin n=1 Tax=Corynebacterium macclintockiae TaxID=2913501 RepID=A0A9X3RRX1_9CORY|nr:SpaH/EbpB family LPXTG-anchored major pilin [Corynebacterium macclintockiae]MCZ9305466.1 SpaH/EbpB family LPXTG-anchored major pilin [Corynebacterium macclintockiae]